ncbi:TPA: N-acetylmuramoyl-L-alanine amidase [Corynebacterium striatum]|nr:N-acetylmuramoyl-L-alanine amidase [Corynebacterium striatum]HAT6563676.1 N-acetylmuramoyl-L-alanine amidase [Corynebacterium striatum]HAT6569028.1 N-acetylmuramoyl-L-alanine amidase [Corynebacterium striatum]HAT6625299.1 N-acetylmuramoyl-L-alanine amidase [Corynebacterium striatum]HCG2976161.1 N-acetylmuramoyl-L-alanine amidase [Corynebacterium striatum]
MPNAFICDHEILTSNDDGLATSPRRLLAVHTFEGRDLDAVAMARFQQQLSAGGSYHMVIDADGVTARENDDAYIPWAAMFTGNRAAFHFSLAGRASMSREEWLARPKQLDTLARVLAAYSTAYGIPLIKRDGKGVARGEWGVCGHADISAAWRESDHTDPGAKFPYDYVLKLANEYQQTGKNREDTDMSDKRKSLVHGSSFTADQFGYVLQLDRKVEEIHADILPRLETKLDDIKALVLEAIHGQES